jgi:large subunit ribosomal protein L21
LSRSETVQSGAKAFTGRARLVRGGTIIMYAIIVTGGKQYKVEVGSEIMVEKLDEQIGANVNFDVLMMADGENVQIGTPVVKGVSAKAEVLEHGKGKKVVVFKYKPKKDYRKKQGHRQPYTKVKILSIG